MADKIEQTVNELINALADRTAEQIAKAIEGCAVFLIKPDAMAVLMAVRFALAGSEMTDEIQKLCAATLSELISNAMPLTIEQVKLVLDALEPEENG